MYFLGYDCGTSSVKASLLEAQSGCVISTAFSPKKEMPINAPQPGWAQQNPELWWQNVVTATQKLVSKSEVDPRDIKAIGISYQMHGLVCVDKDMNVLRPSIIWCDSRAIVSGKIAEQKLGEKFCLENLLNLPGNFTAAKLKWVKENEPEIFNKIHKIMLPGDYIAMKMTGQINTTISGLSEGIFWDYKAKEVSKQLLDALEIPVDVLPNTVSTFSIQGSLLAQSAQEMGLVKDIPISYRAGDQPNNALSLNVLKPGQIAATAGTSGVICGIGDRPEYDIKSRVNTFAHVNYTPDNPRYSVLLCVAGTGILNSWLKHNISGNIDYPQMNELAANAPIGSENLCILPFGNGAERFLDNSNISASFHNLNFNIHNKSHIFRAGQEGIVFALNYGLEIMKDMGIEIKNVNAGDANMFLSPVFRDCFATVTDTTVSLFNTDGSAGAARGAGIGLGFYKNSDDAFAGLKSTKTIEPDLRTKDQYQQAYNNWLGILKKYMN